MFLVIGNSSGFQFGEVLSSWVLGNREQGTGNRESGIGNRESGIGNRKKCLPHSYEKLYSN
ncbi:hypothetical protein BJP36_43475 [Moorena producens JHB]|uniref:Uncharacterized protein n=1 Tax=Moorena producens (strain JHB) TaxID=1454205 RepID=A0A9Q9ST94_MOOP1|nr:hypothetical protein [Moorena producens]WAN69222.1 hypothetical protein BJP36_43475 [Moorena producens JHB]